MKGFKSLNNINLQEIEAIIFDLGGVIIDVDMDAPYRQLLTMSSQKSDDLYKKLKEIAYQYEIGMIDDDEFIKGFLETTKVNLSHGELEYLWNTMLGYVPNYMGDLLWKIKQDKRTFILSNTNPIHIQEVKKRFQQAVPDYSFESLFEKIYYSHEINLHKPDFNIFDYVVKNSGLNPEKTLFIDDNEKNVIAGTNYGLQTIYMNPSMNLPKLFSNYMI